ncbi:hypothetical protein HOK51_04830 [Candidatus Woesearchaeota archaeon]|mgnify:CR=1|jgi:hypothetical protein|nr:hypothetical protein [Candidatus Woesearchaeota archaeon]MBT6519150.1 hypothetical protein [Candidatus Woesearchaeota archaeon]MBT7367799.1 hypothetical protein [Candidatus Woesearchaeota archaeon]
MGIKKETEIGTIRIKTDLIAYQKTTNSWKKLKKQFPQIKEIAKLFKLHNNFDILIDQKKPNFLKGQLSPNNKIRGARIVSLPDGTKLDKAYSLFANNLTIHDQSSDEHWDVLFQNQGGTWAYSYSLDKKAKHVSAKYKKVNLFDKKYPILIKNVFSSLKNKNDPFALPMYTLLKTKMRVGNEIYYKLNKHKGLTTLKKKDIKIKKSKVEFKYVGKDGVPHDIIEDFPITYITKLKKCLSSLKMHDFVFVSKPGKPLSDKEFKLAFKKYCSIEFYPHIVRSHYATMTVKNFIKGKRKLDKQEVKDLYLKIAGVLGHKKFVKKENIWKDSFNVTIHHYIDPYLVERIKKLVSK